MNNKNYTPNEIIAMLEDLKIKFQIIIEAIRPLPEGISRIERKLDNLSLALFLNVIARRPMLFCRRSNLAFYK